MTREPARSSPEVPEELEDLDPGLAWERTQLAWRRTAVAFAAVSAAVLRFDPPAGAPLLVMSAGVWLAGPRPGRPVRPRRGALRLVTVTIVLVALVALVVAVTGEGVTGAPSGG